eukprot:CCRYP_009908-RA/>CCRYP_009908-RA protein AED:0.40 eAED:0.40 QI:27/-1/1/1/-1/0/1/21/143
MSSMFDGAETFNDNLSHWNVSSVTNMNSMFSGADAFKGDLSSWDVGSVKDMSYMFFHAYKFNGNLSSWNVSSVTDMRSMFSNALAFNQDLCAWADTFPYTAAESVFYYSGCAFQDMPQPDQRGPFSKYLSCPLTQRLSKNADN